MIQIGNARRNELENSNINRTGVALFLLSETVFFLILILSFIYFRRFWWSGTASDPSTHLEPIVTGFFSLALFASSGTAIFAELNIRRGNWKIGKLALALTIILGLTFLVGQGREYALLFGDQVVISNSLFGTTFFTLTGFHGMHVFVGLVMLSILLALSLSSSQRIPTTGAVSSIALYWHFVDAVWVFIFSVVYIWTFLL
jgi:heme/copper-type cytochrome/quinol oxidase subunit 3